MSFLIKAVEKARKQRKGESVLLNKKIEVDREIEQTVLPSKRPEKREVEVSYVRTRVQSHDLERLKNNKIISLFDDIEVSDEIKLLQTQVMKRLKAGGGNSLLVTSANSCEGKTFTSINLGRERLKRVR